MAGQLDGQKIRKVLLEVVHELHSQGEGVFQTRAILDESFSRLSSYGSFDSQALLTSFYDLFRSGHLSWGYNIHNPEPPFCHLTEQGRRTLRHLSRDPANPDGYLTHLSERAKLNPVAESYIREALETYNANCFKAAAVMVGAASESLILELRDDLVNKIVSLGRTPAKELQTWMIKKVLDAFRRDVDSRKGNMPRELLDAFEAYWPAFVQHIRTVRNDAGHPSSIDPVTPESVHAALLAALLIFPELASLAAGLKTWIAGSYA